MRSKKLLLLGALVATAFAGTAQVQSMAFTDYSYKGAINLNNGGTNAVTHPSLAFQIGGTNKATRPWPVLTTAQRNAIASPLQFATIANATTGTVQVYNGSSWVDIGSVGATVTSVYGRTGAITAQSGDYNTSQVAESTNLYFSNARARAALSAGSGISYNSSTGVISSALATTAQTQKTFFAGPASGADATPAFRPMLATDLPDLSAIYATPSAVAAGYVPRSLTLSINGTTLDLSANRSFTTFNPTISSPTTGQTIRYNGSAWVNSAIQASDLPTSNTISALSATMPGVIFNSPVTGVNTGGAWSLTPTLKTQAQKTFLRGPVSGADATPTFGTLQATDIPDLSAYYQTVDDVSGGMYFYTEFNTNAGGSDYIVTSAGTGSGAASVSGGGGANRPSTIRLTSGTTATGRAYAASGPTSNPSGYVLGGGTWKFKAAVNVIQASTSTDRFQVMAGFLNNTSTAAQTNGAFFLYDEGGVTNGSTASGNWQCVTVTNISGSTVRTVTTLSASSTNTVQIGAWTPLEIRVNATGSSVDFYINGTLVATNTTNIPTTIASPVGWATYVQKSAGTTAVNLDVDYAMVKSIFTTAR